MKKILTCLLCLVMISGCAKFSNRADSVTDIELSIIDQDYYKNEEIEVTIQTNCRYQLEASDFVMFGGSVNVQDLNTAILTFPSAGTFHVYATVNGVKSNELIIKVVSSNAVSYRQPTEEEQEEQTEEEVVEINPPNIPATEKDFSDLMTLYEADESELANSDEVAENIQDYNGYMFAMQGTIPEDSGGAYLLTPSGYQIYLTGLSVERTGAMRVYGIMEGTNFHVKCYCIVE